MDVQLQQSNFRSLSVEDIQNIEEHLPVAYCCVTGTTKESLQLHQRNYRRSLSVDDLHDIGQHLQVLGTGKVYDYEETENQINSISSHSSGESASSTYNDTVKRGFYDRLAQPKRRFNSDLNLNREYIPLAKEVRNFQNGSQKRFLPIASVSKESVRCTIPHSPKLRTAERNHPLYLLSLEEKEQLEFDKAQKYQFKAHPVNKKVFDPPVAASMKEKRCTVPGPFKLTEIPPKKTLELQESKAVQFHAQPIPKSIYECHHLPIIKSSLKRHLKKTDLPNVKRKNEEVKKRKNEEIKKDHPLVPKATKPIPFSFELRDQNSRNKRDLLVQKYIETKKKSREFHAKPVPKSIVEISKTIKSTNGSQENLQKCVHTKKNENAVFRAKTPTVLYKKPFEPKKVARPLIEIDEFVLNTELRARERDHFEHLIKQKERRLELLREEKGQLQQQQEEEEVMKARKIAEFKAQEIRRYK